MLHVQDGMLNAVLLLLAVLPCHVLLVPASLSRTLGLCSRWQAQRRWGSRAWGVSRPGRGAGSFIKQDTAPSRMRSQLSTADPASTSPLDWGRFACLLKMFPASPLFQLFIASIWVLNLNPKHGACWCGC